LSATAAAAPRRGIEPAASFPGPGEAIRIAACPADRLMHLADETGRYASAPAAMIADFARTDTEVVFIMGHGATIGSQTVAGKRGNAVIGA
jgi:hypothetical protein